MTDLDLILSFRRSLRDCTSCDLRQHATSPVPWRGDVNPTIAVLGMAPGTQEDKAGEPFVGSAGVRLMALLRESGINPSTVTYTNAIQCRPPNDQVTSHHIATCRKWMRGQVAFINPTFLIILGKVALDSVRGVGAWPKLDSLHGKPLFWPDPPVPARPKLWVTYHPAAALRQKKYHDTILTDLAAFNDWRKNGVEKWPEECYVCGEEFYRYDEWGIGYCVRHANRQGILFPEDMEVSS